MKYNGYYFLDVFIVRIRGMIKHLLPKLLVSKFNDYKNNKTRQTVIAQMLTGTAFPWMSPNIWSEIVDFHRDLKNLTILEFGTGASTLWHVDELLNKKTATYIGVEHDAEWYWLVVFSILKKNYAKSRIISVAIKQTSMTASGDIDVEMLIGRLRIILRLRTNLDSYINALDTTCDVIVVDGISRKDCVRRILATNYLRAGGLLMLMEAGRGSAQWWEGKLSGESDYSPEVAKMLSLGGEMLDGIGVDEWVGCPKRSPRPISYFSPMEACKLIWRN